MGNESVTGLWRQYGRGAVADRACSCLSRLGCEPTLSDQLHNQRRLLEPFAAPCQAFHICDQLRNVWRRGFGF